MATFVLDPAVHTTACIPRMIRTYQRRQYRDKQFEGGEQEWKKKLAESSTVYVGNLSCYTNEYQLYELFTRCGSIKRIIMGLDKIKKTPCGFCFVEFDKRESALKSINFLNKAHLDGREIQVDIDAGFIEGRQYGRGVSGGQVGDERRREFAGQQGAGGPRAPQGGTAILTRSITVVACLAILLMISYSPQISANTLDTTFGRTNRYTVSRSQFFNPIQIRQGQLGASRDQFEKNFAQFLVNLMKAAKPSLLKAFIQATLADKQLKEIAIGLFFNNTNTGDDE